MTGFLYALLTLAICYVVAILFYVLQMQLCGLAQKRDWKWLNFFAALISGVVLTAVIAVIIGAEAYRVRNLGDWTIYAAALAGSLAATLLVLPIPATKRKTAKDMAISAVDGCCIELVQRLMMQPLLSWLLVRFQVPGAEWVAVVLTGLVWCLGIVTEYVLEKQPFDRALAIELLASFAFSLGVGYAFQRSGFIVLTMLAHALERVLSAVLRNRKLAKSSIG